MVAIQPPECEHKLNIRKIAANTNNKANDFKLATSEGIDPLSLLLLRCL